MAKLMCCHCLSFEKFPAAQTLGRRQPLTANQSGIRCKPSLPAGDPPNPKTGSLAIWVWPPAPGLFGPTRSSTVRVGSGMSRRCRSMAGPGRGAGLSRASGTGRSRGIYASTFALNGRVAGLGSMVALEGFARRPSRTAGGPWVCFREVADGSPALLDRCSARG
jgi:hypothetical protein